MGCTCTSLKSFKTFPSIDGLTHFEFNVLGITIKHNKNNVRLKFQYKIKSKCIVTAVFIGKRGETKLIRYDLQQILYKYWNEF